MQNRLAAVQLQVGDLGLDRRQAASARRFRVCELDFQVATVFAPANEISRPVPRPAEKMIRIVWLCAHVAGAAVEQVLFAVHCIGDAAAERRAALDEGDPQMLTANAHQSQR